MPEFAELVGMHGERMSRPERFGQAVDWRLTLSLAGSRQPVPDHQDRAVVLVEIRGLTGVMNADKRKARTTTQLSERMQRTTL